MQEKQKGSSRNLPSEFLDFILYTFQSALAIYVDISIVFVIGETQICWCLTAAHNSVN